MTDISACLSTGKDDWETPEEKPLLLRRGRGQLVTNCSGLLSDVLNPNNGACVALQG